MNYSNQQIPEGINASQEHPLKEFFWLSASVLAAGLLLVLIGIVLADMLANRIPFRIEQQMTARYFTQAETSGALRAYLDGLAGKLSAAMQLPSDMTVRVHYLDSEQVNAFATLGGNVFIYRGLLERLPNENSLAMVLAHEIAHVRQRDPIHGMGRAVVLGLALSLLSGDAGNAVLDRALSQGATLTILKYSRDQERAADDAALQALAALYGHHAGAADLFRALEQEHGDTSVPELFSSHPLTADRLARVHESAVRGRTGVVATPLPADFQSWITEQQEAPASDSPASAAGRQAGRMNVGR